MADQPNVIRRPTKCDFYGQVGFTVEWHGQEVQVRVPGVVLDDLDHTKHQTPAEFVASFDRHQHAILAAVVAGASDKGRFQPGQGQVLQLMPGDFPALRPVLR